jgi:small subunit ribosomal protein S7
MSRKKTVAIKNNRKIYPDRQYNSVLITKLINTVLMEGRKNTAEKICYNALHDAAKDCAVEVQDFLEKVVRNVEPKKKIVKREMGGINYSIPRETTELEKTSMAVKFLVKSARELRKKEAVEMVKSLKDVLVQSYNNTGPAVEYVKKLHEDAEKNAAFSHFRW